MPANPAPVEKPPEPVWSFRVVALLGLILFWVALGGVFDWGYDTPTPSPGR